MGRYETTFSLFKTFQKGTLSPDASEDSDFIKRSKSSDVDSSINGGGAHIHILVFCIINFF